MKNMKYMMVFLILVFTASCGSKNVTVKIDDKTENKKQDNIKKTDLKQTLNGLKDNQTIIEQDVSPLGVFNKNSKSWKPSEDDVAAAEKLLQIGFDDQKRPTVNRVLGKKPDDYNQQYIGAEYENGDKYIWINCFCKTQESDFKDWKTKLVFVKDGGNCFINVLVNLTKNTYEEFNVNGNG